MRNNWKWLWGASPGEHRIINASYDACRIAALQRCIKVIIEPSEFLYRNQVIPRKVTIKEDS